MMPATFRLRPLQIPCASRELSRLIGTGINLKTAKALGLDVDQAEAPVHPPNWCASRST
jgi:hypothetical protein